MTESVLSTALTRILERSVGSAERGRADKVFRDMRDSLVRELAKHTVGLDFKHQFVPAGVQKSIASHHKLRQLFPKGEGAYIRWLSERASTTFLVTILSFDNLKHFEAALLAFRKHGFSDECLPIPELTAEGKGDTCSRIGDLDESDGSRGILSCQHGKAFEAFHSSCWSLGAVRRFYNDQWSFLVQKFDTKTFEYHVENHRLLPFIAEGDRDRHKGGFSDVVQASMLGEYLRADEVQINALSERASSRNSDIPIAIKILRPLDEANYDIQNEWKKEADAYRQLNAFHHKHIVRGLGAYSQAGKHHLVLEWANGGSLDSFWENNSMHQLTASAVLEVLEQMQGLTDALSVLHNTKNAHTQRGSLPIFDNEAQLPSGDNMVSALPSVIIEPPIGVSPTDKQIRTEPVEFSWRHGDIKPSNILRFVDSRNPKSWLGILKLADLGSAKHHKEVTQLRATVEVDYWHTMKYEPPDAYIDHSSRARSRLYDIWSLGCVFLEFTMWLVWGSERLEQFDRITNEDGAMPEGTPFWSRTGASGATVSQSVSMLMETLRRDEPFCKDGSALGDVLKVVQEKMLVVELPPTSYEYTKGCRANANHVLSDIAQIVHRARAEPSYLLPRRPQLRKAPGRTVEHIRTSEPSDATSKVTNIVSANTEPRVLPIRVDDHVKENRPFHKRFRSKSFSDSRARCQGVPGGVVTQLRYPKLNHITQTRSKMTGQFVNTLRDNWHYENDEVFAESTVEKIVSKKLRSKIFPNPTSELCEACTHFDPASPSSFGSRTLSLLRDTSEECYLCEYLYHRAQEAGLLSSHEISLSRYCGEMRINNRSDTRMRICRSPGSKQDAVGTDGAIPTGIPKLNRMAISQHTNIIQQWLLDCDKHESCAPPLPLKYCPRRLLYLGKSGQEHCRLIETVNLGNMCQSVRYAAFSHPWGVPEVHKHFKSTRRNCPDFLSNIAPDQLPMNYQDAIRVCRAIDVEYLWIDSICILQAADGDPGDFKDEAAFIQDIFGSAYVVIAASSARGTTSGFLNPRKQSQVLALPMKSAVDSEDGSYYISDLLDDFEADVLDGPLNERGWVMQERALARRTIYFTANQAYFECGQGVRCETLGKLRCDRAAFLGDSDFPTYGMSHRPGAQVYLITALYEQYSTLKFTEYADKPVAISGMEHRLTQKYGIRSGAGVFHQLSGKWLLWERAEGVESLSRISFPDTTHSHKPPSWSFMSYIGAIAYINVPHSNVTWNDRVRLTLSGDTKHMWLYAEKPLEMCSKILILGDEAASKVRAQNDQAKTHAERAQHDVYITYDNRARATELIKTFVIVGTFKLGQGMGVRHYVLAVTAVVTASGDVVYERVGAGWLPEWLLETATETHVFHSVA